MLLVQTIVLEQTHNFSLAIPLHLFKEGYGIIVWSLKHPIWVFIII